MPYIKNSARRLLEENKKPLDAGELNYLITQTVWKFLKNNGLSYKNINTCVGALECAKLELYARIARPYEKEKQQENGDVFV